MRPLSTRRPRNASGTRDPDMHQTRKGRQWYFGMKAHIGVDSKTKLIHAVVATAANVHDATILPDLLHGEETRVWGDQAYKGQTDVNRTRGTSPIGDAVFAAWSTRRRKHGTGPNPGSGRRSSTASA